MDTNKDSDDINFLEKSIEYLTIINEIPNNDSLNDINDFNPCNTNLQHRRNKLNNEDTNNLMRMKIMIKNVLLKLLFLD